MRIKSYRDLLAWQKAMMLVEEVYRTTKGFPKEEIYALTQQIRRAAISVPSNIAEGHSRTGSREFVHRLSIANGSLSEGETQMEIARRLGYISAGQLEKFEEMTSEIGRILQGLMNSLEKLASGPRPLAPSRQ